MYLPVFWMADPSSERQSGLLVPRIGVSGRRGFSYEQPYLLVFSPSAGLNRTAAGRRALRQSVEVLRRMARGLDLGLEAP